MSPRLTGNLVTVFGMALWASGFPATEILLESWHPLLLAATRLLTASLVLLGIMDKPGYVLTTSPTGVISSRPRSRSSTTKFPL